MSLEDVNSLPSLNKTTITANMFYDVSQTSFFSDEPNSPLLKSFNMNEFKNKVLLEGEVIRRANQNKFKKYWYRLLGNELCAYKSREEK